MRKLFEINQRVEYTADTSNDKSVPVTQGAKGTVWSVGVGKSWIWVMFDDIDRPVAVRLTEVDVIEKGA